MDGAAGGRWVGGGWVTGGSPKGGRECLPGSRVCFAPAHAALAGKGYCGFGLLALGTAWCKLLPCPTPPKPSPPAAACAGPRQLPATDPTLPCCVVSSFFPALVPPLPLPGPLIAPPRPRRCTCRGEGFAWCRSEGAPLGVGEAVRFPYAVLEIKLQVEVQPEWIKVGGGVWGRRRYWKLGRRRGGGGGGWGQWLSSALVTVANDRRCPSPPPPPLIASRSRVQQPCMTSGGGGAMRAHRTHHLCPPPSPPCRSCAARACWWKCPGSASSCTPAPFCTPTRCAARCGHAATLLVGVQCSQGAWDRAKGAHAQAARDVCS